LVLCTIMISLFLGFTKRRAELVAMKESAENTRKVLQDYSVAFLDQVIPMVTAATIICYALYTVDGRTVEMFKSRAMLLTVPCVIYGLFRYIYLIYHQHKGQDPTYALCHDVPTIANLIIWVGLSVVVIKYGAEFNILG
ncbi:MAG: decaprenyl-phosphate phosphoribosyltransferase, partial [Phycisphaerae bacterium]|nr:decaprenyl-phosphate phosphoribosyltransferase [Phycisphaerae bacterium]